MENEVDKKFTWVIKNFNSIQSEKIYSDSFVIGGCKWRLLAFPRGNKKTNDDLSLYLKVADSEYLPNGWRRHVEFSLTVVNHSSENLSEGKETEHWFDQKEDGWGFTSMIPHERHKAKNGGFLVNGEVKIVVEVDVLEVIGKLDVLEELEEATQPLKKTKPNDDGTVTSNLVKETPAEWVDVNGFQVLPSQVDFARRIFERHPEIALEIRTKNQDLRTSYMNVLLSLIKMLYKWPQDPSTDDLSDAEATLAYMRSVGFKLDWLEKKLDEVKENKKKCARVCEMEQQLLDLKQKCKYLETQLDKEKAEILEATAPDLSFSAFV